MNPAIESRHRRPGPPPLPRALALATLALAATAGLLMAQYGGGSPSTAIPFSFDEYPSFEGVLAAHDAGKSDRAIVQWIRSSGAYVPLSLDQALQIKARGVGPEVCAAMSHLPSAKVDKLLGGFGGVYVARSESRRGLSRRQILKMLDEGATDGEISAAVAERGSRADLSLAEAIELQERGLSASTLSAVARGTSVAADAAPAARAAAPAGPKSLDDIFAAADEGEEEVPLLDDIMADDEDLAEDEGSALDEDYDDEDEIAAEAAGSMEAPAEADPSQVLVFSDSPDARAFVVPGSARVVDLMESADGIGRTPARKSLDPGPYYVMVEKRLDPFDRAIIPAFRTVHDGSGRTRTLIESGGIYYDSDDCCLPRSLQGEFSITRISENQQGVLLGDAFDGLPPYIWDGNRFLILTVEGARVTRILKVYEIRKAAGERQTIVATFTPSHRDPLLPVPEPSPDAGTRSEVPLVTWKPDPAELTGIAEVLGFGAQETPRVFTKLQEYGKAVCRKEDKDGRLRLIAVRVDSYGRLGVLQSWLGRSGPYDMYSTISPPTSPVAGAGAKGAPAQLMKPERTADPTVNLPVLAVTNSGNKPAVLLTGEGQAIFLGPGQTKQTTVAPGATTLEAVFADAPGAPRQGRVTFSYYFRYKLIL